VNKKRKKSQLKEYIYLKVNDDGGSMVVFSGSGGREFKLKKSFEF
jgi:RPA family protein